MGYEGTNCITQVVTRVILKADMFLAEIQLLNRVSVGVVQCVCGCCTGCLRVFVGVVQGFFTIGVVQGVFGCCTGCLWVLYRVSLLWVLYRVSLL